MTAHLEKILAGKQAMRKKLAALPVAEKLRILDTLRAREVALRAHAPARPDGHRPKNPAVANPDEPLGRD